MFKVNSSLAVIFVFICSSLVVFLAIYITKLIKLYQQRRLDHLRRIEQMNAEYEMNLLNTKLLVQEQTFQHISRDIHDNIGQKLTLARLNLNLMNYSNIEIVQRKVQQTAEIISECLEDLRDISRSLSTDLIMNNGLVKAIEHEIQLINKSGLFNIKLFVTGDYLFQKPEKEIILFRILQECLSNIMKHAQASKIEVKLISSEYTQVIQISDNGKGFDPDKLLDYNGLQNIKSRAHSIDAIVEINSAINKGTLITIKIPLDEYTKA